MKIKLVQIFLSLFVISGAFAAENQRGADNYQVIIDFSTPEKAMNTIQMGLDICKESHIILERLKKDKEHDETLYLVKKIREALIESPRDSSERLSDAELLETYATKVDVIFRSVADCHTENKTTEFIKLVDDLQKSIDALNKLINLCC